MTNKSELIREFIRSLFDTNHDFSNREQNKLKFIEYFETEEKKPLDISWAKHQTLFIDLLDPICKERGVDVRTFGYGGKKERIKNISQSGVKSTITPKPKESMAQSSQSTGLQAATSHSSTATGTQQQTNEHPITPLTDEESVKLTKILCNSFGNVVHRLKPKFEPFDEDEALELSTAISPLLKPYLERYGGKVLTALAVTISVMSNKGRLAAFSPEQKGDKSKEERQESELPKGNTSEEFAEYQKRLQKK